MAIKIVPLSCPNCGATVDAPVNQDCCFCTYCGAKLAITDDSLRIAIDKNINETKHVIDDAAIAEVNRKTFIAKVLASFTAIVLFGIVALVFLTIRGNANAAEILLMSGALLFCIFFYVLLFACLRIVSRIFKE